MIRNARSKGSREKHCVEQATNTAPSALSETPERHQLHGGGDYNCFCKWGKVKRVHVSRTLYAAMAYPRLHGIRRARNGRRDCNGIGRPIPLQLCRRTRSADKPFSPECP